MTRILKIGLIVIFVGIVYSADDSPCSSQNRENDLDACLQAVKDNFQDVNQWWFGTSYATRCPITAPASIECTTTRTSHGDSIASILFSLSTTFDSSTIDRYLDIEFTSEAGEYTGCSYHHVTSSDAMFTMDPSSNKTIKPWDARAMPEVEWEADDNKQYTLIIQDVGYGFMHGVYVNIPGDDLDSGLAVKPYQGPLNMRDIPNPYSFLLFEQENEDMTVNYPAIFNPMMLFNTTEFQIMQSLKGPLAVSWMSVGHDPYAVERQRQMGFVENCSPFITEALEKENLPFVTDSEVMDPLPGYAEVAITTTEEFSFTYCCQNNTIPPGTVNLDPISNIVLSPAAVRSGSQIAITLSKNSLFPNRTRDFKDQLFTVVHVDPDIPAAFATAGSRNRPLVHQLVTNLRVQPDGLMVNGTEVQNYRGPRPPKMEPLVHGYYFLIYKQSGATPINVNSSDYTGPDCDERISGRCLFDVSNFKLSNNMELYAASWMKAGNDDYVQNDRGVNQTVDCAGRPGYEDPCGTKPTPSGAVSPTVMSGLMALLFVIVLLV